MTRPLLARLGRALVAHAMGDKYPTRALEYALAWIMFVWAARVAMPGAVMTGPVFQYFLVIAPEFFWGVVGMAFSGHRIVALIRNGNWRPGPRARAVGAGIGFNFWLALAALYTMAVWNGAPDFPFRYDFGVLALAELFCFARCYQDYVHARAVSAALAVPHDGG